MCSTTPRHEVYTITRRSVATMLPPLATHGRPTDGFATRRLPFATLPVLPNAAMAEPEMVEPEMVEPEMVGDLEEDLRQRKPFASFGREGRRMSRLL